MSDTVLIEIIKLIPTIFWILFIVVVILSYRKYINRVLPRTNTFKAFGFELSFFEDRLDRATKKQTQQTSKRGGKDLDMATINIETTISQGERSQLYRRLTLVAPILEGAQILWVDDNPDNNIPETRILRSLGMIVNQATSTDQAQTMLKENYDLIISDMSRNGVATDGLRLIGAKSEKNKHCKIIFYVGEFNESQGVPLGAFAITNRPDHLLHYILDALERDRN